MEARGRQAEVLAQMQRRSVALVQQEEVRARSARARKSELFAEQQQFRENARAQIDAGKAAELLADEELAAAARKRAEAVEAEASRIKAEYAARLQVLESAQMVRQLFFLCARVLFCVFLFIY
jgi:hypothetical protein